jgi:hypothetical protein
MDRRFAIPYASHAKPKKADSSVLETLLNQYPKEGVSKLWNMRVHVKTCDECRFHLRLDEPSDEIPAYELPENITGPSESLAQLEKWALAGSPSDVRCIIETVSDCPQYDPPSAPMFTRSTHRTAKPQPHHPAKPQTKPQTKPRELEYSEELIGPQSSKYFLMRPRATPGNPETFENTGKKVATASTDDSWF